MTETSDDRILTTASDDARPPAGPEGLEYPGGMPLPQPLRAPFRQIVFWSGLLCVGLAGLGVVLPLLPTTPLLIVAAACFARTDPRFHRWLLTNRVFGPLIRDWQNHRCIPLRAKILTVIMVGIVGGSSVVFFIPLLPVQILVGALLIGLLVWILSHPSAPPRPGASLPASE
jgi:hypothetical protein